MKDECGERKAESGMKCDGKTRIFILSVFSLSLLIIVSCSSQQPVSSTICGDGFQLLGGLDSVIEISNDEEWILVNCESINGESKYVRVFRVDGSASWKVSLDGFPWNTDENDPLARLISYHWMEDGKGVYLRPVCCYDPGNHGIISDAYGLYLLDLQTGELSIILSGKNGNASPFSLSISPDGEYFVYVDLANRPNMVNVTNLQMDEEKVIKLDEHYQDVGVFVWTPDVNKLIFVATSDEWKTSSLYILEMNSFALTTIVESDERLLLPANKWDYQDKWGYWKDENTLFLTEFSGDRDWAVNILTNEIVEDNSYDGPP